MQHRFLALLALAIVITYKKTKKKRVSPNAKKYSVGIIGAGVGGIAAAHRMREAGIEDIVIYEGEKDFGGTWLKNNYPDCGCDVFSQVYSFSFAPNPNWSRTFSKQEEILQYILKVAEDMGLRKCTKFRTRVVGAMFDGKTWNLDLVNCEDGTQSKASHNFLISATGQLNVPFIPNQLEANTFQGPQFHTSNWDSKLDLSYKVVACIGTGASAIQALPIIAPKVKELLVFQRSPGWIISKNDNLVWSIVKWIFRRIPLSLQLYRWFLMGYMDLVWLLLVPNSAIRPSRTNVLLKNQIIRMNPHYEQAKAELKSSETLGCKRMLLTDDWYPMFNRSNVRLITKEVGQVLSNGLKTIDGQEYPCDVVVFATGFATFDFLPGLDLKVKNAEKSLKQIWKENVPQAYKGMLVAGFPNFCWLYGANTNVNHTSVLALMECALEQFGLIVERIMEEDKASAQVKQKAMEDYNVELQKELSTSVFNSDCNSWYKKNARKIIVNNYSKSLLHFWLQTRVVNWNDFILQ